MNQISNTTGNRFFFFLYLLLLLLMSYAVQDFRTSANTLVRVGVRSGVHLTLFAIMTTFGLYYAFTCWREFIFSPVKTALWLIAGWIATACIYQGTYDWNAAIHFGLSCLWILQYHFFSYYLRRFPEALTQVKACMSMMFLFYVFSAVYAMFFIHAHLTKVGVDRLAVVNLVYNVLVFVPWLSLLDSRKLRIAGLGIVLLVVLCSMKRGAIIVYPLMLSTWMLVEAHVRRKGLMRPVLGILFLLILFVSGLAVADQFSNGFLSQRFSAKQLADGSGRADSFSLAFKHISEWSIDEFILGTGKGFFSHNDWFEFLFSYGFIGVMLYAALFISLAGRMWQLVKSSSPYAPAVAMVFVYMSVVGLFGAVYFVHSTLYVMAFLGAVEGLMFNDQRNSAESRAHIRGVVQ